MPAGGRRRYLDGASVEGFALHLPMSHGSHLGEVERLLTDIVASGIASRRVYVSHLTDAEMADPPRVVRRLRAAAADRHPAVARRPGALQVAGARSSTSHEVERGDVFGYRGRTAPKHGHILVVCGGTAHGIGLEAPTGRRDDASDRAARVAKGGLDAAGFVRSPFTIAGKQRLFAEPPHMQVVDAVPARRHRGSRRSATEVDVQVRFTATAFDRTLLT